MIKIVSESKYSQNPPDCLMCILISSLSAAVYGIMTYLFVPLNDEIHVGRNLPNRETPMKVNIFSAIAQSGLKTEIVKNCQVEFQLAFILV